jgi:hypothetical protein
MVFTREVAPGTYVKLAVALAGIALAAALVRSRWRSSGADIQPAPLTHADIAYQGPGDDTFAELIGASGAAVNWPRVACFYAALVAMGVIPRLLASGSLSLVSPLLSSALVAAAAVAAFRYVRSGMAPLVAGLIVALAWIAVVAAMGRSDATMPGGAEVITVFVRTVLLLAGLSWAMRRMGPRPLALWFGAMWGSVAVSIMRWTAETAAPGEALTMLLGPVVFAAVEELSLRWTRQG